MENEEQISRTLENVPGATLAYKLIDFIDDLANPPCDRLL